MDIRSVMSGSVCEGRHFKMYKPCHRKQQNEQRCRNCYFSHNKFVCIHQNLSVTVICFVILCISPVHCQTINQNIRPFPPLFNAAQYRPVLTEPSQGTCGVQERSAYCRSSIFPISVDICNQDFCVQHCSSRSEIPSYLSLLVQTTGFSNCVFLDTINVRPGSEFQSASTSFISSGPTCFVTPSVTPDLSSTLEFTISVWMWLKKDNNGTLIQKVSKQTGEIIFELNIRGSLLNFVYKSDIGLLTVTFPDKIPPESWTYVAIQVYGTSLSFFINGVGPGFSAAHTVTLISKVQEEGDSWVRVGLTLSGTYQFLGRLQDFRFYPLTLSNREIAQDYSGEFPALRIQSHCRCPASHPRVKPLNVHYCIKNGEPDNTNDHVLRLNLEAHPLEYVNDGDANSIWISDFRNQINLLVDLGDQFQVFYVVLLFYSPLPMAVEVQRKRDNTSVQWETWQQFASDCQSYFNAVDNGPIPTPSSVNCLKISQNPPEYSKGNITFNILNPEPVPRPGYNDFYNTPELFDFVTAQQVRVRLQDHFFVTNERHRYYGLYEYSVIARCECHGHAASCEYTDLPYQCNCLPESHTQGRQCDECQPLYNDKPFRRGDQVDAYSCRPCECYNHATECEYNVTLDPFPDEHYSGGGGVCINCQHHTEGQHCDTCVTGFYRPTGTSMYSEDVCNPCDCFPLGVQDLQMYCEKEGGQCACKENVEGRQCNICKSGFFNLTADNVLGCQECGCSEAGTLHGDTTCSPGTGQCNCKSNVRGFKCDSCQYGFFRLKTDNPYGCEPCNCNPFGSTNQYCDPDTGQCTCKLHITSRQCSQCEDGFWAFEDGCLPCGCDPIGTEPAGKCDKFTGQCTCKANVVGLKCDQCKEETFGFGISSELGCVQCTCNSAGTLNGSMLCDNETGDCLCKINVQGSSCNQCKGNTWGLSLQHETGCIPCDCDPSGTQQGDTYSVEELACNQNTGYCACLANRIGRQCDDCLAGYYVSTDPGGGCLNCVCHSKGTLPLTVCDSQTGQCECRGGDSGVTGVSCDECLEGYYGFDGSSGSCQDCDCATAGSVNSTCDPFDGQCYCKEFTTKRRCDKCVAGSSFLDEDNPFGCSKAPDQQPPPEYEPINSTSIQLLWKGPDYPNGLITQYMLFRNGSLVYTLKGDEPAERTMVDTGLHPYTLYSYVIQAENAFGSVQSAPALFRTPAGAPYGVVILNVTDIQAKSAGFFWNSPQIMNGPLWKYVLYSETEQNATRVVQWEGQQTQVSLTALIPFTNYIFHVDTCTTGGCLTSEAVKFPTMSSVPEGMSPPVVMALNNTALHISWNPPEYPNGIVIFYELWMRGDIGPDGVRFPSETRIFHPSGQFNPRPTQYPQENALPPPATEYILTGLIPFTLYEFQVLAENSAGKAASAWVSGRTGATTPLSTPAPTITGFSPFSLNISWEAPSDDQSRGIIIEYRLYYFKETDLFATPHAPPFMWSLVAAQSPDMMYYILGGLSPYSEHTLMIEACNSVGCVNSTESVGRTNQDIPEGLEKPLVNGLNSSAMDIMWQEPAFLNGPQPSYMIQKTIPALSYPPQVISGTRFPGGGYYLFPPDTIPPNVDFTGIKFWFRTSKREGLLLFAASEGQQSEFVALQFKHGRPWFLFDPQGCASFVTPNNDEGLVYSNNIWHEMVAWRDENVAYISIDNVWTGSRTSRCAKGTIIGPNTGVYIGGLPADFEVRRKNNKDQRLQIIDQSFQGCIRDIQIMQQKYPVQIWKTLDWNDAIHNELAFLNWEGCPINLDKGIHFMGQGYARLPANNAFQLENEKTIKFGFRTQMHTGILLFSYGGSGIYYFCAMINGAVHFEFANRLLVGSVTFSKAGVNFCDSKWYSITLEKKGQQATVTVDGYGTESFGDPNVELTVITSSDFYVGGVPAESEAHQYILNNKLALPVAGFGGCIKDLKFDMFQQVADGYYIPDFLESIIEVVNINMDGCAPFHLFPDQCKDDLITQVYNGTDLQTYDVGLHSYTDYLYRVVATNNAGSGKSQWGYGRTKEGSPVGVTAPYEEYHYNGYLVKFKWLAPVSTAGLMTKFVLQAYNLDNETIPPVEAVFTNTSKREGNMTGMIPFTSYNVKMVACTSGGCSESSDGLKIQTKEEAPENVPAPQGESGPRHIFITWDPPAAPNGNLTGYFLYMDETLVYTGAGTSFNVTNELREYTSYVFYLKACTKVGCTQGPTATLSTAQLRPKFVNPPVLTALGTSSVEARWETPDQLNGVLERYLLYLSAIGEDLGTVIYNNSDLFLDYTINGLNAGSTYYVTLSACTGGGCTLSEASNITTAESAPALIQPPIVTSPSPSQLHVEWEEPGLPNGKITQYQLYHNEIPKYTGLSMYYDVGGLAPYSKHVFRVVACTRSGCSSSKQTKAYTQESQPEGFVTMDLKVDDERTVSVKWTVPEKPNGNMFFDVYFEGLFYADIATWDYSTIHDRRSLNHSQLYHEWVTVTPLIPMSTYNVQVNASNTVGFILGNLMTADMPPGSPDGVKPPTLLSQTPTTITATWISVGRENALDSAKYILQFKEKTEGSLVIDIFGPTTSFTFTMENLVAYTEYEFRLVAENSYGVTRSDWVTALTRQDRPAGFSAPRVVGIGPRNMDLIWSSPLTPNGVLSEYKVYQNGQYRASTAGNTTQLRVDRLKPNSMYIFVVEVCTAGGCTRSPQTLPERTKEDYPEDVSAPVAVSLTPASVELSWEPPANPNGIITLYTIERRLVGKVAVTVVVSLSADSELRYIDDDSTLTPYVEYEYRLIASNGVGDGASPWTKVTTMSSRPAGVTPPKVQITGPTIMTVTWDPPLQPNGIIEFYTVRLPIPESEIRNISVRSVMFEDLLPYTEYAVTVTACTRGGCTQSYPVNVRTHAMVPEGQPAPVATPVSQTMISIVWQSPTRPNGPNIRYELSRLLLRAPLEANSNTSNEVWTRVFSGTGTFFEDRGLPMYSTYMYRVTVFNDIGQLTSDPSSEVTTFGGFPRRAAKVTAEAISHRIVVVSWETPNEVDLQGSVRLYTVNLFSSAKNYTQDIEVDQNATTFRNLNPNTQYYTTVTITIHGGAYITSDPVYVTTLDGAPEGVDTPTLSIVSETAIRVSWMAPEKPNGDITGYNIYVNMEKTKTGLVLPGSYIITGLQPYTVYEIQLEVCTVFDCVKSDTVLGSTLEALPQSFHSPRVLPLSAYQIDVVWKAPLQPNGIILRYELYRRTIRQCSEIPEVTVNPELMKCTYVQCGVLQNLCGSTCYSGTKVCCDGILHESQEKFACCGQEYVKMADTSDICCGGKFYTYKENYQCCNGRFEHVVPGEICCSEVSEDRVAIGKGDSCCGSIPYSTTGSQICCSGQLYGRHEKQCCGGEIVADTMVCCGDELSGHAYMQKDTMSCCGQQYIRNDLTLCCKSDTGHIKVHFYSSAEEKISANEKCCGIETISNGLSCCNFVGYNPVSQVCADRSHQQSGCGSGVICPRMEKDTAFCDRCDFDPHTHMCGSVAGYVRDTPTSTKPHPTDDCVVEEQMIYSGLNTDFLDDGLSPFSLYEYSVSVVNSAGRTHSNYTRVKTLQANPEGLSAPNATLDPKQLFVIFLTWKPPVQPNGEILRFILVRDGIELYRGLDLAYTDDTTILPYRSYTYILTACTVAGCVTSPSITVATAQSAPEGVHVSKLEVLNATALLLSWPSPDVPNGIISEYKIHFVGGNHYTVFNTTDLSFIIADLLPYTSYSVTISACTQVACTNSSMTSVTMPEAAPEGVYPPEVIVKSSTSADIYWSPPTKPNGVVIFYALLRSDVNNQIRVFLKENFHVTDYSLLPGKTYMYFITTGTKAGNTSSEASAITMPDNTPSNIPAPGNVTVISATEIYVQWSAILPSDGVIDQYRVLLNAGRQPAIDRGVGLDTEVSIRGLMPFTEYEVRIQACLQGVPNGCGTGPGLIVKTYESAPVGLDAPLVLAYRPNIVDIHWKPPEFPNGIIAQYLIYYRQSGSSVQLLINRVNNNTFHIRHAGSELTPFTDYEYKVVAGNSQGDVSSPWSMVRTKAAPPEGLPQPSVTVMGAFSVQLKWVHPAKPNGVINIYIVTYKKSLNDPTVPDNTETVKINGSVTQTFIGGLDPDSEYKLQITAVNSAGNISSTWTKFTTGESSPSGLGQFDIEKIESGIAVILRWGVPVNPNGIVTTYRIFEEGSSVAVFQGLNREFELRRLEPFTEYSIQLEACTSAGCTRSSVQTFFTAETIPEGQTAPVIGESTHNSVTITWGPPAKANGRITMYEVYRRTKNRIQKRSVSDAIVVYRTTTTEGDTFSYTDTNVQPFTEYQYIIKASNSKGSIFGPWQSAFTSQAPPEGVQPPTVSLVPGQIDTLQVTWQTPYKPNGILQNYHLQRNDSIPLSFTAAEEKKYLDTGLMAFTYYMYTIRACSGGGCTTSAPTIARTKESAPMKVSPPTLLVINSTSLRVTWQKPQVTTGSISAYQLHMNGVVVYEGMELQYIVTGLVPFTDYTFKLTACTAGGCTDSGEVFGKPDDDVPQNMAPPILRVMSSSSIEISWQEPEYPNGVITSYDVRRNGRLIYTESISVSGSLRTTYTDYNLDPGMEYSFVVLARNRKGSVESPASLARTWASSPNGLNPPKLSAVSATSIQVSWTMPTSPNGLIKNYTVYKDAEVVYSGGPSQMNYIVPGLQFWTEYTFRVQACTERGCVLSTGATGRTLSSRPEEQPQPDLLALASQDGAHAGVLIEWEPPEKPNGIIERYEVFRRQVIELPSGISYGLTKLVYNGSQQSYSDRDSNLLPYTKYEYMVTAVNAVGKVNSLWKSIQTKEAPPDSVPVPSIVETTSTTITVKIHPPTDTNGAVRYYNVLVNDTLFSTGKSQQQTVGENVPLLPYRFYAISVQACTAGGCKTSPNLIVQTGSAKPVGQEPVRMLSINSTAVRLAWDHPSSPNGNIRKFILNQRRACPPMQQPFKQLCSHGDQETVYEGMFIEKVVTGLTPYMAYEFQVVPVNDAGAFDFPVWVRVETKSEAPKYVKYPVLQKNDSLAVVDWSDSFILNGRLLKYLIIMDDGNTVYSGVSSVHGLERSSPVENLIFKIRCETEAGTVESAQIIFDPRSANNVGTTPSVDTSTEDQVGQQEFYEEVWFIALMVVIGVLILLILLACCIRKSGKSHPYIRERLPLQSHPKKQPFNFSIDGSEGSSDGTPVNRDKSGYYSGSVVGVTNPSYVRGPANKRHGSYDNGSDSMFGDDISQEDAKDYLWDPNPDSGLVSNYDSESIEAPSYSVTKEQTVFTDTHL